MNFPAHDIYVASGTTPGADAADADPKITQYLNEVTKGIAVQNLEAAGYPDGYKRPGVADSDYDTGFTGTYRSGGNGASAGAVYEYEVEVRKKVDLYLADLLPNMDTSDEVVAGAKSRRNKAHTVLVLDHSHSMGCPSEGDCSCLSDPSVGACQGKLKMDDLLDATADFYAMFDVFRDEIVVVPFNTAAITRKVTDLLRIANINFGNMNLVGQGVARAILQDYPPEGLTNMSDAFIQTIGAIDDVMAGSKESISVVGFFDGGATAMRALFSDTADLPRFGEGYDYTHYSIEWLQPNGVKNPGPGVLVPSGMMDIGYIDPNPPAMVNTSVPSCSPALPIEVNSADEFAPAAQTTFASEEGPCLNSLETHIPGDPARTFGRNYGGVDANCANCPQKGFEDYLEMYSNYPIQLADYIREQKNGTIYVIGLGPVNPALQAMEDNPDADPAEVAAGLNVPPVDPNDPYWNVFDNFYLKKPLLNRIAMDFKTADQYPEFNYSGYNSYEILRSGNPEKAGIFLPTADTGELRQLFKQIARKILLQLIA